VGSESAAKVRSSVVSIHLTIRFSIDANTAVSRKASNKSFAGACPHRPAIDHDRPVPLNREGRGNCPRPVSSRWRDCGCARRLGARSTLRPVRAMNIAGQMHRGGEPLPAQRE
jgi:hypothetical protein